MTKLEVLKMLQELLKDCGTGLGDGEYSWPETEAVDHNALCDKIAIEIHLIEEGGK